MSEGSDIIKGLPGAESVPNFGGMVDAALEISRRRRDILTCLRDALLNERNDEALKFARQLCGIEDWQMQEQIERRAKQIEKKQNAELRQAIKRAKERQTKKRAR